MAVTLFAAGSGCSTSQVRLYQGENGNNRVVVRDIERDDSEEEALKAATKHCEKEGKKAVFAKGATANYTGSMDESTRNTVRKASTAGMIVGGVAGAAGERTAGGILGTAGVVGKVMTNDRDYQTELEFKCQ